MSEKVVFIGLGRMGSAMAQRVLEAGLNLSVFNRDAAKAQPLAALGAKVMGDPKEAIKGAGLVFTMVSDDRALLEILDGDLLKAAAPGLTHVSMSTVGVQTAEKLGQIHAPLGQTLLSCPVFGRPEAAKLGKLNLCLAGPRASKDRVMDYLSPMGKVWDFGPRPEGANAAKLAGNFMIASLIELLSEAFSLVENHGVSPQSFFELMSGSLFDAPAVHTYGGLILAGEFDRPGFLGALGAKDLTLVKDAARLSHTPMPFCSLVEDRFIRLLARGWGQRDWSAISELQREDAGLKK
ncbi:MAG: NAD(P)-dependent oxidoreductase [Deltaproteobacteria bacterium]|jgi:3-hydroxyisobutyrate dehydrogenase-like beta-hydroxyacid dehydrogenase|nr:NAD(P)-dependent oxidoreductase [Deltaproteobacteria bacterium]